MFANVAPSCVWPYRMHCTHQPYKQIWAHPLPKWTPSMVIGGGATTSEIFKKKKPNVKLNIMDEGYPLNNEGIT